MKTVCLEGINGCGKSTIIKTLVQILGQEGVRVLTVVNPGTTELGNIIRPLARQVKEKIDPLTQLFLFCATKTHLINTTLFNIDNIKNYDICLMDRFWLSTYVYQVVLGGCDYGIFVKAFKSTNFVPDHLVLIDADPSISLGRAKGDSKFEELEIANYAREEYKNAVENLEIFGKECSVLYSGDLESLTESCYTIVKQVLGG